MRFERTRLLGKGAYGHVHSVRYVGGEEGEDPPLPHPCGTPLAWKRLLMGGIEWDQYVGGALRELYLSWLTVGLGVGVTWCPTTGEFGILMRQASMTLSQACRVSPAAPMAVVATVGLQVAADLAALHAQGYVHHDVKPENVLLQVAVEEGVLRAALVDFSLTAAEVDASLEGNVYSLWWRPPELLCGLRHHDSKADVWALGVVLLELATGQRLVATPPSESGEEEGADVARATRQVVSKLGLPSEEEYCDVHGSAIVEAALRAMGHDPASARAHGVRPRKRVAWPPDSGLAALLQAMLAWNPRRRPTMAEVVRHEFWERALALGTPHGVHSWMSTVAAGVEPPAAAAYAAKSLHLRVLTRRASDDQRDTRVLCASTPDVAVRFDALLQVASRGRWALQRLLSTLLFGDLAVADEVHTPDRAALARAVGFTLAQWVHSDGGPGSSSGAYDNMRTCGVGSGVVDVERQFNALALQLAGRARPYMGLGTLGPWRKAAADEAVAGSSSSSSLKPVTYGLLLWCAQRPSFWCTSATVLVEAVLRVAQDVCRAGGSVWAPRLFGLSALRGGECRLEDPSSSDAWEVWLRASLHAHYDRGDLWCLRPAGEARGATLHACILASNLVHSVCACPPPPLQLSKQEGTPAPVGRG